MSLEEDLRKASLDEVETHISRVFFTEDEVFKVKKAVDFGFLDFSTVEARKAACEAEVAVNARLAPSVYRGVVPVTRTADGRHEIDGSGEVVDWAVRMRRLPDAWRADVKLAAGDLGEGDVEAIARRLARFHASSEPDDAISAHGTADAVAANVRENFEQTRDRIAGVVEPETAREIEERQLAFIERHRETFDERIAKGRVRDGHGDLRLEHVYFEPDGGVLVIDGIEFNDRFRYGDVCADIAFLSMDLAEHGRVDLAERFIASYAREADDHDLYVLVDFYESYRAYVRGKIALFLASDDAASFDARERAKQSARRHLLLALAAQRGPLLPPALVAVGGAVASGKSTTAGWIGSWTGAPVVSSDRVRKSLAGVDAETGLESAPWSGAYTAERTDAVYAEALRRAGVVLRSGRPVVVDASFRSRAMRARAKSLARELGVPFRFVECRAGRDALERRLRARESGTSVSDARVDLLDAFLEAWESADGLDPEEHVVLDTERSRGELLAMLRNTIPGWPEGSKGLSKPSPAR